MSSRRLVLRYGAVGGGSALIGWAVSEWFGVRNGVVSGLFGEALTCGLIGGAIGAGMNLVANRSGASRADMARRGLAGLASGVFAGAIGVSLGHALLGSLYGSRALGWAIMGGGVGAGQGLYERSPTMLRQGVFAAAVGGLAGGLPFGAVYSLCSRLSEAGSRAAAFVLFGVCVGASIGLACALLASALLTVIDGHRPGRLVPLSSGTIVIGRALGTALRFSGRDDTQIEREHARIFCQPDGRFALEDMQSRHGTRVNLRRVIGLVTLEDGDVIRIGGHSIRFNYRNRRPPTAELPDPGLVSAQPAAQPKPNPAAAKTSRPPVASAPKRQPTVMTPCPKCKRPVPGTRPYCVVCKLSF